jgi:hypothetical protein
VVFSGSFGTVDQAGQRAARAKELGFGDAYPRFVSNSAPELTGRRAGAVQ